MTDGGDVKAITRKVEIHPAAKRENAAMKKLADTNKPAAKARAKAAMKKPAATKKR